MLLIEMREQSVIYPITQQGTVKYISGVYPSIVQMDCDKFNKLAFCTRHFFYISYSLIEVLLEQVR